MQNSIGGVISRFFQSREIESSEPWMVNDFGTRRAGYALVLFLILVVGGWSAFAPLETAAIAGGVVQVEGKRKPIQHLEGGIVSEILVASGDWVEAQQPLILLDAARDRAERDILQGRLFNTRATVERLQAERDDESKIIFSDALRLSGNTDSRAANAMSNERALLDARFADRSGEEAVLKSQVSGLKQVLTSKQVVLSSLEGEIDDLATLLEEGYVDKQRLRELERARARTLGELADLTVSIDETQLKILQLRKRFKTNVVEELTEAQEDLYNLAQQYLAAEDRVVRATVRAPVAGRVMSVKPNTIGAVISTGETLMEIVPSTLDLIVDAQISPMDIDRVRIGQSAEVRFSVFKDAYTVSGTLVKLSADRVIAENDEHAYYAAEIKLLSEDLRLLDGQVLTPGMPAEVLIKTGERTLLGYITSPMSRIFSRSLIED